MPGSPTIVYYDFASLPYSSFYTTGLALNAARFGYRFVFSRRPPAILAGLDLSGAELSTLPARLLCRYCSNDDDFFFCIDAEDDSANYLVPILGRVRYYFKMNHDPAVEREPHVAPFADRVAPIAPGFPVRRGLNQSFVPRVRPCPDAAWDRRSVRDRLVDATRIPDVRTYQRLRHLVRDRDVLFVSAYYPEECHAPAMEFRYRVMEGLRKLDLQNALIGFASCSPLPAAYSRFAVRRLPLRDYLRVLARSRVAVYVRGMLECISFKFGEQLALGLPVAGQQLANDRELLYGLPYFDEQFAYDEPDALVEAAALLLADPRRRYRVGASNATVFDTVLAPDVAVAGALDLMGLAG